MARSTVSRSRSGTKISRSPHDTIWIGKPGARSASVKPSAVATCDRPSIAGPNSGSPCVIHANRSRPLSHSRSTGVGPTFRPNTTRGRPGSRKPVCASANVLPTVGWPAIGISWSGVKIRMRTSVPGDSAGRMNVLSAKFISRAIRCMVSASMPRPSVNTASWLP